MLRVGVIGCGYWGPNIIRNFNAHNEVSLVSVCDKNAAALEKIKNLYPEIETCADAKEITHSSKIDVVCVVTPVSTHYGLALEALKNGKHVFVEKPFTATAAQAEELIELAEKKKLMIMVDHTFLFTSAVRKIKEVIDDGTMGDLYYYDSTRVNLGLFQHDVNVIWDLAPHDFSIMDYVLGEAPVAVSASGVGHVNEQADIAYVMVYFQNNMIAHFNVNWLSPVKIRTTLVGGQKRMLVWNDLSPDEKIKIYDKGIDISTTEGIYNMLVNYRSGDMWAPRVAQTEALKLEVEYFVDCIKENKTPFNDGEAGLRVVKLLEACNKSIQFKNVMVNL